jgi:outer membrane protein OmpA-like peptidoglycan-associated protein
MLLMHRIFLKYIPFLLVFLFIGCPHMMVQKIMELQPPKGYRPVYQTSEIMFDSLLSQYPFSSQSALWNDSLFSSLGYYSQTISDTIQQEDISATLQEIYTNHQSISHQGIQTSIIRIDDSHYPDSIIMLVKVTDSSGHFIKGLAGDKGIVVTSKTPSIIWKSLIDSSSISYKKSRVGSFSVKEIREDQRNPLALSFVLDHSPSMGNSRAIKLQEAVRNTMDMLYDEDYISVIKFTSRIHTEVPLMNNYQTYTSLFKIDGLRDYSSVLSIGFNGNSSFKNDSIKSYGSGTALYDGTAAGIEELKKVSSMHQRIIVLFSDGGDNSSKIQEDSIIRLCRVQNIPIFSIAYGMTDEKPLKKLSAATGGKMYRIYTIKEFPYVLADIVKSIKNHYRISYKPPKSADIHKIGLFVQLRKDIVGYTHGYYDKSLFQFYENKGSIHIANIQFESGTSIMSAGNEQIIDEIVLAMNNNPELIIEIRGHTDNIGTEKNNLELSLARAQSVASAIVQKGIMKNRLIPKGMGESEPLHSNENEEQRKQNRRTEFIMIRK